MADASLETAAAPGAESPFDWSSARAIPKVHVNNSAHAKWSAHAENVFTTQVSGLDAITHSRRLGDTARLRLFA